jgi:hypothetical protein
MQVDFNHPLSGKSLRLTTIIGRVEKKDVARGGSSTDWIETLTAGPGMQARWQNNHTGWIFCDHLFEPVVPDQGDKNLGGNP